MSIFSNVSHAPSDPILGLNESFSRDERPDKVNLTVGLYQNAQGQVPIMDAVRQANEWFQKQSLPRTYAPIDGFPAYHKLVQELLFEALVEIDRTRLVTVTALGGTGALKLGADFLKFFLPNSPIAISSPSWENHTQLFEYAQHRVVFYRYYNAETKGLDFDGLKQDLMSLPEGSVVLLHACCHNPTGVDLNSDQWSEVMALIIQQKLIPFLDLAYQGFDQGLLADSKMVSQFAQSCPVVLIANSFSKNFSLYGERVGALTMVLSQKKEAEAVRSQLKRIVRTNYSNPPRYGAELVSHVLSSEELQKQWQTELSNMRNRLHQVRRDFSHQLSVLKPHDDFSFIEKQRGMFSYSGLNPDQVNRLRVDHGVYVLQSGRISLAGLNQNNMSKVCQAIAKVLDNST